MPWCKNQRRLSETFYGYESYGQLDKTQNKASNLHERIKIAKLANSRPSRLEANTKPVTVNWHYATRLTPIQVAKPLTYNTLMSNPESLRSALVKQAYLPRQHQPWGLNMAFINCFRLLHGKISISRLSGLSNFSEVLGTTHFLYPSFAIAITRLSILGTF